jgi:hypothetical protein
VSQDSEQERLDCKQQRLDTGLGSEQVRQDSEQERLDCEQQRLDTGLAVSK